MGTVDDQPVPMAALGWDGLSPEEEDQHRHLFMMDNNRRRLLTRVDNRSPFPPGFMVGSNRDAIGGKHPKCSTVLFSC